MFIFKGGGVYFQGRELSVVGRDKFVERRVKQRMRPPSFLEHEARLINHVT